MDERKLAFFNEYLRNGMASDTSYDCSEIVDDFLHALGDGKRVVITSVKGNQFFFNIQEYGEIVKVNYHELYVADGYVFDPRYAQEPVLFEQYLGTIQGLNEYGLIIK